MDRGRQPSKSKDNIYFFLNEVKKNEKCFRGRLTWSAGVLIFVYFFFLIFFGRNTSGEIRARKSFRERERERERERWIALRWWRWSSTIENEQSKLKYFHAQHSGTRPRLVGVVFSLHFRCFCRPAGPIKSSLENS